MKKITVALAALILTAAAVATPALAAIEVGGSAYVGFFDKYLWRGFDLSGSQPVVQGGVNLSTHGFTLGYWTNVQASTDEGAELTAGEASETDITLDYTYANDYVALSVGNIYYMLDEPLANTSELYLGVTAKTVLSPTVKVYYDWDEAEENGLFYTASVSHAFAPMEKLNVGVGALVSYNDESDFSVGNYSDWHNYELSASATYAITDQLSITPSLVYSSPISDEAKDAIDSEFLGGVTLTLTF
ncbi:MAG: hypothetical protein FDZ69_08775 [Deltaproteobacteria bacterium]|nr:MAG: hypothetical protein FDZ69_08775 [Deltaproteobacteria bacterium]